MSLTVNIAGQWTATAAIPGVGGGSAAAIGILEYGWTLGWRIYGQTLRQSDKFARSQIERFHQGLDVSLSYVAHEWKTQELALLTVSNSVLATSGVQTFNLGLPGSQATDTAAVIVLSSIASTPARTNSFTSITLHAVSVDEDFDFGFNLGPEKAMFPFRGVVWPITGSGSTYKYFTTA